MKQNRAVNILFVAPCVLTFLMVIVIPFFFGLYYSLTNWNGVSDDIAFVGLKNFSRLMASPDFVYSFLITIAYTLINIVFINVVSFVLSLVVTSKIKRRNFYRSGFFVPYLIGGIVLGYIWQFILNNILVEIGTTYAIQFFQTSFLSLPHTVIWTMAVVNTWQ